VDINPNSVKICRLRLWIELLKNAYYTEKSGWTELETFPNIDINIKCGNSLISRFALDIDLKSELSKLDYTIEEYKNAVHNYKNTDSKERKQELLDLIEKIKKNFRIMVDSNHPLRIKKKNLLSELDRAKNQGQLFNPDDKQKSETIKQINKLSEQIIGVDREISELVRGEIYKNAFEWRFEFPELLDGSAAWTGFDAVIGNPPYIDSEKMSVEQPKVREYLTSNMKYTKGNWDIYIPFFELAEYLVRQDGFWAFITPSIWLVKTFGLEFRVKTKDYIYSLTKAGRDVFEESNIDAILSFFQKTNRKTISTFDFKKNVLKKNIEIDKKKLNGNYEYDFLFSGYSALLLKIDEYYNPDNKLFVCENACATSDCYTLETILQDININDADKNKDDYYKVVNTGTLSKYITLWGKKPMRYLKKDYKYPVADKKTFKSTFPKSYGSKTGAPKLIAKGLNLLDVSIDYDGVYIPGKTTFVFFVKPGYLEFIAALFNSKLVFFYLSQKYQSSNYCGGLSYSKDMFNNFPVIVPEENIKIKITELVQKVYKAKSSNPAADTSALEAEIDALIYKLYGLCE